MIKYLIFYLMTIPSAHSFFGKNHILPKLNVPLSTDKIDISKKLDIQSNFFPFKQSEFPDLTNHVDHNCLVSKLFFSR